MNVDSMDVLYSLAEEGHEIYVNTLDPMLSEYIAKINVNEAVDMVRYLYAENGLDDKGRLFTDSKYKICNAEAFLNDGRGSGHADNNADEEEMDAGERDTNMDPVSYDYLVAVGCRFCDSSIDFKSAYMFFDYEGPNNGFVQPNEFLRCQTCNSIIAPIFKKGDSDSLVDSLRADEADAQSVYLYGTRSGYVFEESGKRWWKSHMNSALLDAKSAKKSGKQTVKQICEKCGHDTHTFSTFQARSADEGMSVMYECTKCGNRLVIAT
ncbi:conserved hypothetical protein [Theileria equi strain WA]|uniref:DNA-directed RNA polymerase I subunit RPA12 n=1 Tax=Theileria equi strain WA TaxID=1537102 RepID=L1LFP6_THEEQ|nr:conserved hypothetical protein [Theileria equi strain WA]EKX73983.1 conserved hypothetical protein [Theileria equi strain WA]|eukprot:XP_004833435.1 conserved hypothetical protein [Theileria equi strain WA]